LHRRLTEKGVYNTYPSANFLIEHSVSMLCPLTELQLLMMGATMNLVNSICIDGWAGSGKTTLSIQLASLLLMPVIHTGVIYREITRIGIKHRISHENSEALISTIADATESAVIFYDAEVSFNECKSIFNQHVDAQVPRYASNIRLREKVVTELRELVNRVGPAILEGRDTSFSIAPESRYKIYLKCTANNDERLTVNAITRNRADNIFLKEKCSPTSSSLVIDTDRLPREETLKASMDIARKHPNFTTVNLFYPSSC
jgi:cytidylate kinase